MPKPHDHFREHLSSDIAYSRSQMVSAILCDSEALEELDEYSELRMDFDLGQIGQKVEYIRYLVKGIAASKGNVQAELWALHNERIELAKLIEEKRIEIAPLAFMRGRTLSNAVIILDEAQNCTSMQMEMFLTRIGENSRMIVTGDPSQVDLPPGQTSGLGEAIGLLKDIAAVAHVPFTDQDVVRHELIAKIVRAYDQAGRERSAAQAETTPPRPAADGGNGK